MARRIGGTPWWAVLLSGIIGAVVATLVTALVTARPVEVHTAAATASAAPTTTAPAAPKQHSVAFLGDSWTVGVGATALKGYADLTAEQLGWTYWTFGVGGSGYSTPGGGSTFDQRVDRVVEQHPEVIVVEGSLNDQNSSPEAVAAGVEQTLTHLQHAAAPQTKFLILGGCYNPATPNPAMDRINGQLRAAAERHGMEFVDPSLWVDKNDASLWFDPYHPKDVGYRMVADRLGPLLQALVGS